jgi:putative membrane protein
MKNPKKLSLLCILTALTSLTAYSADDLKHRDHEFVEKAAKSGLEEVAISKVAVDRAQNPEVKSFAQMMVSDHTDANTQLSALAAQKGVTLPLDKTNVEKWSTRSANGFDEEYIDKMVSDHKDAVELFEKEAKKGEDPDLKSFAEKTLPTLMAHYDKVKGLKKALK